MLLELSEKKARKRIAQRIAADLEDGALVNLGIGIPQLVPNFLPKGINIYLQTENGTIHAGPAKDPDDLRIIDAGGSPISVLPGGSFVASDASFGILRGGHIDATVLGALQVDADGSLANWTIPNVCTPGMGGAMDIVAGAKKVYIATRHFDKNGCSKLLQKCTMPLTGYGVVDVIVTEYCLIRNIKGKMVLEEIADGVDLNEMRSKTGMQMKISRNLKIMNF
ncbi:MAG: 3-oxoacid CoA-transferase subunit B [Synergistaceae bacterium]|nr:3-oxoacid CoA-transferase subunit B [Synergistaceae bacterium]